MFMSSQCIHFPINSLTSLNFVTWLNMLFPMISYIWAKKFTTCGINYDLYSYINLLSRGNTCLNNNCLRSLWISYTFSWSLITRYTLDFGRQYKIPWHKCCNMSWISRPCISMFEHFSAISFTSTLALLKALNILVHKTLRLFSTSFSRGSKTYKKTSIAFTLTFKLGSETCLLRISIKWQLDRYCTN